VGELGGESSASYALHNWVVNGIISLPYLAIAAAVGFGLVRVALWSLGLVETEDRAST